MNSIWQLDKLRHRAVRCPAEVTQLVSDNVHMITEVHARPFTGS